MLVTYSYATILGAACIGILLTKILFLVRDRIERRNPPRPELVSFDRAEQANGVWRFRLRNAGETVDQGSRAAVIELDEEGYPIRSTRHKTVDKWHPDDLIEIEHDCEGMSVSTLRLHVYCTGPNDLRVTFRGEPIQGLSMVSTEVTTFP
jgi:hypothetical protein